MDIEFGHMTKRELAQALSAVADLANMDAMDDDTVAKYDPRTYVVGRSDMANRVLQTIAKHSEEARA